MSESFQRKESALAEREKRDKTENSHEGDAASEGLEKFVDSAHEEVDSGATELIERADEKIDNGPERFGLDKEAGNKIFASGGFAERINSLKSRITSLAANTKTKISSLIDGKSESGSEAARRTESAGAALEGQAGQPIPLSRRVLCGDAIHAIQLPRDPAVSRRHGKQFGRRQRLEGSPPRPLAQGLAVEGFQRHGQRPDGRETARP